MRNGTDKEKMLSDAIQALDADIKDASHINKGIEEELRVTQLKKQQAAQLYNRLADTALNLEQVNQEAANHTLTLRLQRLEAKQVLEALKGESYECA